MSFLSLPNSMDGEFLIDSCKNISFSIEKKKELITEISWIINQYCKLSADLIESFRRQALGFKLVYALDFDIIYAYINPWLRNTNNSQIIEYIIENDRNKLTLTPGTIEEIYRYILYTKKQNRSISKLVNLLKENNATEVTLEAAKKLLRNQDFQTYENSINIDSRLICLSLINLSARLDNSLKRLEKLLLNKRFIPLTDIYNTPSGDVFNREVMNSIYIELARIRKGEDKVNANHADAMNLATIINFSNDERIKYKNNPQRKQGYFIRLLTATRTLLNANIDNYYSDFFSEQIGQPTYATQKNITHSTAMRNCYEALVSTIIANSCEDDYKKCFKVAYELFIQSQNNEASVSRLDSIVWNDFFTGEPVNQQSENEFYKIYLDLISKPVFSTMKNLLIKDSVETMNKIQDNRIKWWEGLQPNELQINDKDIIRFNQSEITTFSMTNVENNDDNLLHILGFTEELVNFKDKHFLRWRLENQFTHSNKGVINFEFLNGTFYFSWSCSLVERQILKIINDHILTQDNFNFGEKLNGEILLDFMNGDHYEQLCQIQSISSISFNEYIELIKLIPEIELQNSVPSKIICDTTKFNLSVDCQIPGSKENQIIIITFRDKQIIEYIVYLFKRTGLWRENHWAYADKLFDFISYKAKDFYKNACESI